jgi:hypothetical protein
MNLKMHEIINYDILEAILSKLSVKCIVQKVCLINHDFNDLCHHIKTNDVFELPSNYVNKMMCVTENWLCIKFRYVNYCRFQSVDLAVFKNLHELELIQFGELKNIDILNESKLRNLSLLIGNFVFRAPNDIQMIGQNSLHTLKLKDCQIENLNTMLKIMGNVHTVKLFTMTTHSEIIDTSALSKVHYLTIGNCDAFVDLSALGNLHTFWLSSQRDDLDYSLLVNANIHTLTLSKRVFDTNKNMFKNIVNLCSW